MLLRKFGLVMWKNLLLRKRHWIVTSFEIVIPVALFILAAVIQSQLSTSDMNRVSANYAEIDSEHQVINYVSANYFEIYNEHQLTRSIRSCNEPLLYAPNNNFTRLIVGNITFNDAVSFGK
jgi:hypothetical protein